ncbi:MAG: hypothetical protein AB1486_13570 [Planctomycetota bacterium]
MVSDLAGHPLAFAERDFDPEKILIEYELPFQVSTIEGETYRDLSALTHLFQGVPRTDRDPDTGEVGVRFYDLEGLYGPVIADFNLRSRGVLQGAPVAFHRRIVDDQPGNQPPDDPFTGWPMGVSAPMGGTHWGGIPARRSRNQVRSSCHVGLRSRRELSAISSQRENFSARCGDVSEKDTIRLDLRGAFPTLVSCRRVFHLAPRRPRGVAPYGDRRALCASGPLPKPASYGDNSRYFYAFDYVKVTSVIRSPFVQCVGTTDPVWLPPIYDPPLSLQPWGTLLRLELRAADDPAVYADKPEEGWTTDLSQLEGHDWIQFRVRLVGNPTSRLAPVLDSLVLPYERRDG